jgi:hypothetical protein
MRYGVDTLLHVRGMRYVKKNFECIGARRQNLSCLRVEKPGCVGSRQVIPAAYQRLDLKRASSSVPGMSAGHRVPLTCSSGADSSAIYLPKTALAALASLCPAFPVTDLPSSPAYTYLKQPLPPLQIFNQKI